MRRVMAPVAQGGPMMVAPGSLLPGFYTADWTPPTKALSALDESCPPGATGVGRIALDDQILGPWLQTVTTTLGQHQPAKLRQLRRLL